MPSLLSILRELLKDRSFESSQQETTAAMIRQGVVVSVRGDGLLYVQTDDRNRTVQARPVHDEPLTVGDAVWVQETSEGYIVHGGDHR